MPTTGQLIHTDRHGLGSANTTPDAAEADLKTRQQMLVLEFNILSARLCTMKTAQFLDYGAEYRKI
jgi:hypothetical protein